MVPYDVGDPFAQKFIFYLIVMLEADLLMKDRLENCNLAITNLQIGINQKQSFPKFFWL